jgi:MinD-like ATPase involved in chromosome partitioning or flagellar assembly
VRPTGERQSTVLAPHLHEDDQTADGIWAESWRSRSGRFTKARPAELARRVAVLEGASVFASATDDRLRALARRLRLVRVPAGTSVVSAGEAEGTLYFISSGSCRLTAEGPDGRPLLLGLLGPGDFFGETSLLSDRAAPVSATATQPLELLALDRQSFEAVLGADTEIRSSLGQVALQRTAAAAAAGNRALATSAPKALGSLLCVYSPKGGVGRSTIALNLAASLNTRYPREVALVDLSFPFNDIALMTNLVPATSLARIGQGTAEDFAARLTGALIQHPSGLHVLPAAVKNEDVELITADVVVLALNALRADHRYVVVDLGPALTENALNIFERSDALLLVATPELASVKAAADVLRILKVLGIALDRIALIVNNRAPKPAMSRDALRRLLGRDRDVEIGYQGNTPEEAVMNGSLLVLDQPRGEMARAMRELGQVVESRQPQPGPESAGAWRAD